MIACEWKLWDPWFNETLTVTISLRDDGTLKYAEMKVEEAGVGIKVYEIPEPEEETKTLSVATVVNNRYVTIADAEGDDAVNAGLEMIERRMRRAYPMAGGCVEEEEDEEEE